MNRPRIYFSEYQKFAQDAHGRVVEMPAGAPVKNQSFNLTDRSQVTEPFDQTATFVDISATAPFCIAFGDKPEAVPTLHRIDAGRPYRHAIKAGERIAFILSEDAMSMMGPGGDVAGLTASESLKRAIDLFSDPKATKEAIKEFQKVEAKAVAAAKEARKAQDDLAERQASLKAAEQAVTERETALTNDRAKFEAERAMCSGDLASLATEREAFATEFETKSKQLADDVAKARTDIEQRQQQAEQKNAEALAELTAQTAALDTRVAEQQAREADLKTREKSVSDREAVVRATEKALAKQIKKLRGAGIHVADVPEEAEKVPA